MILPRRVLVLVLLFGGAGWAAQDPAQLKQVAAGKDPAAAVVALVELEKLGTEKDAIVPLAKELLLRDRAAILVAASLVDATKSAAIYKELTETRAKAIENLQVLEKGEPVNKAKQFHAKLKELLVKHNATCAIRWQIVDALRRRRLCIGLLDRQNATAMEDPADAHMARAAAAALAIPLDAAINLPSLGDIREPHSEAPEYPLWFYRVCRDIEAYNKTQADVMNKWETITLRFTNEYRESLGLKVLEIDPRLAQSARQHSKEMTDLNYFNHTSPTPDLRSSVQRMRRTGYVAGWRENIAKNVGDPGRAFWLWFGSPGHHASMIAPDEVAIGIGRWDNAWTMNLGHAERLMLKSESGRAEELAALNKPGAAFLKPQPDNAKLPPVVISKIETEITIIDPKTGERIKIPGPTTKPAKP